MFSVIIPLYNKAPYICRAIDSVLQQSFKDFEVIVVNDGSTDGGAEMVTHKFQDQIQVLHQSNKGVSVARNAGIAEASGVYIAFLDADDYWHPAYLAVVDSIIQLHPEIGLIGTKYDAHKLNFSMPIRSRFVNDYWKEAIKNTLFFTSATVMKKTFFENQPGFDQKLKLGEDIDVWLRAYMYFGTGIYIDHKLVFYNQSDLQAATSKSYALDETLMPKLFSNQYETLAQEMNLQTRRGFYNFRERWVLFNLFSFFKRKDNQEPISNLLSRLKSRNYLVKGFYYLPFASLHHACNKAWLSKQFRNYMKFCFRHIYS
ncbi:glycosyltransferase family A protein [Echinicola sp. 20G]|uniref:glycosyltransferase family 2 protein n=1 Tax=Echinicola sp. 20G TaxID=2781961 RepID=UPI001910FE0A|nr:glycosyltransferase family A protein [Echinicola sp. 20G]